MTACNQGLKSGTYFWPGSEVPGTYMYNVHVYIYSIYTCICTCIYAQCTCTMYMYVVGTHITCTCTCMWVLSMYMYMYMYVYVRHVHVHVYTNMYSIWPCAVYIMCMHVFCVYVQWNLSIQVNFGARQIGWLKEVATYQGSYSRVGEHHVLFCTQPAVWRDFCIPYVLYRHNPFKMNVAVCTHNMFQH